MVRVIGGLKLIKGFLLLATGLGALKFLNRDLAGTLQSWLEAWNADPDNQYLDALLSKLMRLDAHDLALVATGAIFYAVVFLVEGAGLLLAKHWAEVLTVIVTASFIPLELYHLAHHFSAMKVGVIVVNAAILIYLAWRLRNRQRVAHS